MTFCGKPMQAGFSLFEVLIALALMSVLLLDISAWQMRALLAARIEAQHLSELLK